jgi:hypothetical protein
MDIIFIYAFLVTLLFFVAKVIEMKYIDKEMKPLKQIIRDLAVVYVSSLAGAFISSRFQTSIHDFFNVITKTKVLNNAEAQIFTGEPGF